MIINYDSLNEALEVNQTKCGMPVYMISKKDTITFHMAVMVNFGSINLNYISMDDGKAYQLVPGTAHFLEHKLFESKEHNLFQKFSNQNASVNAYTNLTSTVYYFSCTDKIEENIKLLLDSIQNPYITEQNVEKEKGIILQEIKMYRDNPAWRVYSNYLSNLFLSNFAKYEIAGSVEDIYQITPWMLLRCYEDFYLPSNMAAFCIGDMDSREIFDVINDNLSDNKRNKRVYSLFPSEKEHVGNREIHYEMDVAQKMFVMGFKNMKMGMRGDELLKKELILNILMEYMFGSISEIYEKLYEKNLIDNSFSYATNVHNNFIFNSIGGISSNPEHLREVFLKETEKLGREGIDSEMFDSIKNMLTGNFLKTFDNNSALLNNLISYKNKHTDFFNIPKVLKMVNIEDLMENYVEFFNPDLFCMSVVEPKT